MRIGQGYDVHKLVSGRKLILGGIEIPYAKGLMGHSDADVLLHAIMDAMLGAAAQGDIGGMFPDSDDAFKNIDSAVLLGQVKTRLEGLGYVLVNLDCTIVAQAPKLADFIPRMREKIAGVLGVSLDDINVKATTEERLGFTGRGEGISAHAVVLIDKL